MPVRTIARDRDELVTVSPNTTVREAAGTMQRKGVGSVVVERNDEPVGILTDRDLAMNVVADHKDPDKLSVQDVMTHDPVTVDADEGVFEVCRAMRERGVRRLPVVDGGKLVGIVTLDDLFVLIEDEMSDLSKVIRAESPPFKPA